MSQSCDVIWTASSGQVYELNVSVDVKPEWYGADTDGNRSELRFYLENLQIEDSEPELIGDDLEEATERDGTDRLLDLACVKLP